MCTRKKKRRIIIRRMWKNKNQNKNEEVEIELLMVRGTLNYSYHPEILR